MKKIFWGIFTIGIILLVNWGAVTFLTQSFSNVLFIWSGSYNKIRFLNSSGAFMSDLTDSKLMSTNNDDLLNQLWFFLLFIKKYL